MGVAEGVSFSRGAARWGVRVDLRSWSASMNVLGRVRGGVGGCSWAAVTRAGWRKRLLVVGVVPGRLSGGGGERADGVERADVVAVPGPAGG